MWNDWFAILFSPWCSTDYFMSDTYRNLCQFCITDYPVKTDDLICATPYSITDYPVKTDDLICATPYSITDYPVKTDELICATGNC